MKQTQELRAHWSFCSKAFRSFSKLLLASRYSVMDKLKHIQTQNTLLDQNWCKNESIIHKYTKCIYFFSDFSTKSS